MIHLFEDLSSYTNGFSKENLIESFLFGKVYLGEMEGLKVTVKIWDNVFSRRYNRVYDNEMELHLRVQMLFLKYILHFLGVVPKFVIP